MKIDFFLNFLFILLKISLGIFREDLNSVNNYENRICDIFTGPSNALIVAGRNFSQDEVLLDLHVLSFYSKEFTGRSSLKNYIRTSLESKVTIFVLGIGNFLNNDKESIISWSGGFKENYVPTSCDECSIHTFSRLIATSPIQAGHQIRSNFRYEKGKIFGDISESIMNSKEGTVPIGSNSYCVTDTFIDSSQIPYANKGLFVKKSFKKGDLVTVSPVHIISKHEIETASIDSIIMNYCISSDGSDVALLPLGLSNLINHGDNNATNLIYQWFEWNENNNSSTPDPLNLTPEDLYSLETPLLNLAFYATRDIVQGEELLINYGREWETSHRQYLEKIQKWLKNDSHHKNPHSRPKFRHFIEAEKGLFPAHWFTQKCFGDTCPVIEKETNISAVIKSLEYTTNPSFVPLKDAEFTYSLNQSCDIYLAQSKIPFLGRGMFAGRNFSANEIIGFDPVIPIRRSKVGTSWVLSNYFWKCDDDRYQLSVVGAGSLANHRHEYQVHHYLDTSSSLSVTDIPRNPREAYTTHPSFVHYVDQEVLAGEELFVYYGETWLSGRDIPYNETAMMSIPRYTIDELERVGQCVSHVYPKESSIPGAGKGLFAKKSFKKGDIVTVSPVALLPKHTVIDAGDEGSFINYCFSSPDSDVALYPLSIAVLINHNSNHRQSNVEIAWHNWEGIAERLNDTLALPVEEMQKMSYAQLDVAYIATRDIEAGEEITLDYGADWSNAYIKYLNELNNWIDLFNTPEENIFKKHHINQNRPRFRRSIMVPDGLFPDHWRVDCIGNDCEGRDVLDKGLNNSLAVKKNESEEILLALKYLETGFRSTLPGSQAQNQPLHTVENKTSIADGDDHDNDSTVCELFWAPSKVKGAPRGVIAGRSFVASETIQIGPSFPIPTHLISDSELTSYMFRSLEDRISSAVLGPGNLFNHFKNYSVDFRWIGSRLPSITPPAEGYTTAPRIKHYALRNISLGEEIFGFFGESYASAIDTLVESGNYEDIPKYTLDELKGIGHCLSNVYVNNSSLPKAGRGLFARKSYKMGDLVTVSPVLFASRSLIEEASIQAESLFLNYVFIDERSDVAVYPTGWAGMANHNTQEGSNMKISWHVWEDQNESVDSILNKSPEDLIATSITSMTFAYHATRDITEGEELTIYYGREWESAWKKYLQELLHWNKNKGLISELEDYEKIRPVFKQGIGAPEGLFPSHWKSEGLRLARDNDKAMGSSELKEVELAIQYLEQGYPSPLIGNLTRIEESRLQAIERNRIASEEIIRARNSRVCDVYLAPSKNPLLGRGIIAGRRFQHGEPMFGCPEIFLHANFTDDWQTKNYVWSSGDDRYSLFAFGVWGLYNSRFGKNQAGYERYDDSISVDFRELTTEGSVHYEPFHYFATSSISPGEEIFTDYGKAWFRSKGIEYNEASMDDVPLYDLAELQEVGICLSDIQVKNSTISDAGYGVFSNKRFKKGDLVTVSPVLILPRKSVEASSGYSPVLNFVLTSKSAHVVLLPLTEAAIINHNTPNDSNLNIEWYSWGNENRLSMILNKNLTEILTSPYTPLDIAYYATRDIDEGEELTLFYGELWEAAWEAHLHRTMSWLEYRSQYGSISTDDKPHFRHPIIARDELFPSHWAEKQISLDTISREDQTAEEGRGSYDKIDYVQILRDTENALRAYNNEQNPQEKQEFIKTVEMTLSLTGEISSSEVANNHTTSQSEDKNECSLYLAPSLMPYLGRGLVAGREFEVDEIFEISVSIPIPKGDVVSNSQLMNYVYGSGDGDYHMLLLGGGSIYNHMNNYTSEFEWQEWPVPPLRYQAEAYATYTRVGHYARVNISTGQEIFVTYGPEWCRTHNIDYDEEAMRKIPNYSLNELRRVGHCMSNIEVKQSLKPLAGNGIFAKSKYQKGEIVSISAVLCLEKEGIESISGKTVLLNYAITDPESGIVFLPLNYGALANHDSKHSNMIIEWYSWTNSEELTRKLARNANELRTMPFAPLDIAYRATRDIAIGEELTIDYGEKWDVAWKDYLEEVERWARYRSQWPGVYVEDRPQFRYPITAPPGMFPAYWSREEEAEEVNRE